MKFLFLLLSFSIFCSQHGELPHKRHNFVSIVQVFALHRCDNCPEFARWKITIGDEIKYACEGHGVRDTRQRFLELKKSEEQ